MDGSASFSAILLDTNGSLYGTTVAGGTSEKGTVFKLATDDSLSSIYPFNGTDGAFPYGSLVSGGNGFSYGSRCSGWQSFIPGSDFLASAAWKGRTPLPMINRPSNL